MYTTEKQTLKPCTKGKLPDPTRRNRFFYGKMMDAYHFELETDYLNAKRWLLNRMVLGYGVVCGIDVKFANNGKQDEIYVTAGVAIDKWGRELIIRDHSVPVKIPQDVMSKAIEDCKQKKNECECCIQVVLCYHECTVDPTPVLADQCGCESECTPGSIRESYCIDFRPGCAKPPDFGCPCDQQTGTIDYKKLVDHVTRSRRCLELPKDPCIPIANIPLVRDDTSKQSQVVQAGTIDIDIRPIVFNNRLLFELLNCVQNNDDNPELPLVE